MRASETLPCGVRPKEYPMRRISLALVCIGSLLASACSQSAVRRQPRQGVYGSVIGSFVVELERAPRSAWDGFFEDNLAARKPDYVFHFANLRRGRFDSTESVRVRGAEPVPFVISLRSGPAALRELELVLNNGPGRWLLAAISPTDGKRIPIDLRFSVDPGRITYIGRIRVVLPSRLQLFSSHARIAVEDASAEDRASMNTLIELSRLPVETVLAQRGPAE